MTNPVRDDSHSDYHAIRWQAEQAMHRGVWAERFEPRFVPFGTRELRSDLPPSAVAHLSDGKHFASYRGVPMAKNPLDLAIYEMFFYELQPRTIIELGAYTGASALWMADRLETFNLKANVWAVDIDLSLIDPMIRNDTRIRFLQGDCHQIESVLPSSVLSDLPHPLVLIDDAHVNISGVYRHFHEHGFQQGDYLIAEDTIPWIPGTFGGDEDGRVWGDWKWKEIQEFFEQHASSYAVDRYFTDFFGYNATWNWNGFVKRIDSA